MESGEQTKRDESGADNNSQNSQALIDAINMRSMSLITLTSIATLYFIDWAQAVLLPLVVAVLISYALEPLVAAINRLKVPRPLAAAVVLILLIGIIAGASIPLKQEAMAMLDKIPVAIEQFQQIEARRNPPRRKLKRPPAPIRVTETHRDRVQHPCAWLMTLSRSKITYFRVPRRPWC